MSLQVGIFRSEVIGKDERLGLPIFDRAVTEEFLEKLFFMVYGDGVFPSPSTAFQLRAGTGLTAAIQPGALFCQGKFAYDTEAAPVTFTQNSGEQNLIARLVFRRDLPNRTGDFVVLYGTPAAEPQAPSLTRTADIHELGIADVLLKAGAESITDADITDLRMDSSLCGIITGSLEITDTTEIFAQFKAIFQGLFDQMETEAAELEDVIAGIEQGSEMMLRTVYDPQSKGKPYIPAEEVQALIADLKREIPQPGHWVFAPYRLTYGDESVNSKRYPWVNYDDDLDKTVYAALYAAIGDTMSDGAAGGMFNCKKLAERFPLVCGANFEALSQGGEKEHQLTPAEMPKHQHQLFIWENTSGSLYGPSVAAIHSSSFQRVACVNNSNGGIQPVGDDSPHNNMPPYLCQIAHIKT